jgi:hypothetical protein
LAQGQRPIGGSLNPDQGLNFDQRLKMMLYQTFPPPPLQIPHRIWVIFEHI